ncbi:MAG TPA: hypothetical protein VFB12_04660 [Ktedonobacteraceae bacterium]|nr:hypothetical protein [Ktedonobacteraceae bacterium]
MIYKIIRSIIDTINATPRQIIILALVWFFLSTSCGMMGLYSSTNFFNAIMLFFLGVAVILAVFGLAKLATWNNRGLRMTLPDGRIVVNLEHTLDVQEQDRVLLGVREQKRTFAIQYILVTPPAAGSQLVPITCSTCQRETVLRVASPQKRQEMRWRFVIFSTLGIAITIALELGVGLITNGKSDTSPISYVHFVSLLLLFISIIGFARLINYVGVTQPQVLFGHKVSHPRRVDLEKFCVPANAQVQR